MKTIVALILSIVALNTNAQKIIIQKKDSLNIGTSIISLSQRYLVTIDGNYYYDEVAKIYFFEANPKIEKYLTKKGIRCLNSIPENIKLTSPKEVLLTEEKMKEKVLAEQYLTEGYYQNHILRFKRQREVGKVMQLIGVVAVAVAVGTSTAKSDPSTSQALAYGGAAASTLGYIIDLTASRHLSKK